MLTLLKDSIRPLYHFVSSKTYREYCYLFSKYATAPRNRLAAVRFLDFTITAPDVVSFIYQYKEIFLDESYRFQTENNSPVIYDCGANIGISCLFFKRMYPDCHIKAFEADPEIFNTLKGNLERNGATSGVTLVNKAVWIDNAGVDFARDGADGGSVRHGINHVRIGSVRLKELLLEAGHIDLLKLDIEGAEMEVLTDCDGSFAGVERIFFEYHAFAGRPQDLDRLLKVVQDNGFRYVIHAMKSPKAPFMQKLPKEGMDLQLNIYCTRP